MAALLPGAGRRLEEIPLSLELPEPPILLRAYGPTATNARRAAYSLDGSALGRGAFQLLARGTVGFAYAFDARVLYIHEGEQAWAKLCLE